MTKLQRVLGLALGPAAYARMTEGMTDDMIERLIRVVEEPTEVNWDKAQTMVIGKGRSLFGGMTLWQAVIKADPTFPRTGPASNAKGKRIQGWSRIPDRDLLIRALRAANTT